MLGIVTLGELAVSVLEADASDNWPLEERGVLHHAQAGPGSWSLGPGQL